MTAVQESQKPTSLLKNILVQVQANKEFAANAAALEKSLVEKRTFVPTLQGVATYRRYIPAVPKAA